MNIEPTITIVTRPDKAHDNKVNNSDMVVCNCIEKSDKHVQAIISKNSKNFISPKASPAFNKLLDAFIEALIFHHFYLECYIWIQTYDSGFEIATLLIQQLISNDHVTHKRNLLYLNLSFKNGK